MELAELIAQLFANAEFANILSNPLAQFGRRGRNYLGPTLLPERVVPQNQYEEVGIRYRTVIANGGSRYSPAQKKGNKIIGSFNVRLGNSDIADEFTGREYDVLIDLLQRTNGNDNLSMQAMTNVLNWYDTAINLPMIEFNEKQRFEAIIHAQTTAIGDNGWRETIAFPNPAGHRVSATDPFSDPTTDPFEIIFAQAQILKDKGFIVNRIITGSDVVALMARNPNVRTAVGSAIVIDNANNPTLRTGRATLAAINNFLVSEALPVFEVYDLQWRDQLSSDYFFDRGTIVMAATTGQDEDLVTADNEVLTQRDTLGYVGVGRAVGQSTPGRATYISAETDKPPRIKAEGWQTSFPVIVQPEGIAVITDIA